MSHLTFDPPGPGTWQLNANHFPNPVSRYFQNEFAESIQAGLAEATALYGLLITPKSAFVNGFHYQSRPPIEGATTLAEGSANVGEIQSGDTNDSISLGKHLPCG